MSKPLEILLVEDTPHDAELAIHALKERDLANSLQHVIDGQAALDFLFCTGSYQGRNPHDQPKVVFLDLKLPKVDGIEVLRRLRADERTRLLPIVLLTSSREERDVKAAYDLGANSFIVKPVDFEGFSDAIGSVGQYWLRLNETPSRK